jgi:hypothetical protein
MTLASIQLISVPRFVHINVDGFDNPKMADPSTKNGKADVKRDNIESSLLLLLGPSRLLEEAERVLVVEW